MLLIDDINLEEVIEVKQIIEDILPQKIIRTLDIPAFDGVKYNGSNYGTRVIQVKFAIVQDNLEEYKNCKEMLASYLGKDERILQFEEDKFYNVVSSECSFDEDEDIDYWGEGVITFICMDPFRYNEEAKNYEGSNNIVAVNEGSTYTFPYIDVGFSKESSFVQINNNANNKKILIGSYPTLEKPPTTASSLVLDDNCESTSGWISSSASIDSGKSISGSIGLTSSGAGIMASDFGSKSESANFHGPCVRKNLGTNIKDFKVRAYMSHNSTGVSGDPSKPYTNDTESAISGSKKEYYQVNTTSLNVRSGAGTKYKKIGSLKKGYKITNYTLSKGWLKFTYNSKTAYCSASYCKKVVSNSTVTASKRNYVTKVSTAIRTTYKQNSTNKCTISQGTCIRCIYSTKYLDPTDKDKKRYYYKLATSYKGHIGYVLIDNLVQASDFTVDYDEDETIITSDDKTGVCQLYGFASDNTQLFSLSLIDDNEWYEFTYPLIKVNGKDFLKDKTVAPPPKTSNKYSDSNDKLTVTKENYLSGRYGDWNEFYGRLTIERKNNIWSALVEKMKDGKVIKKISKSSVENTTNKDKNLSYLVMYYGISGNVDKASGMSISDVEVRNLNTSANSTTHNIQKFKAGDVIKVDCLNGHILYNDSLRDDLCDPGSELFELEVGENEITFSSDDTDISTSIIYNERFL